MDYVTHGVTREKYNQESLQNIEISTGKILV
jgi:hypothetical protein